MSDKAKGYTEPMKQTRSNPIKATVSFETKGSAPKGYAEESKSENTCASVDSRSDFQRIVGALKEEAERRKSLIALIQKSANSIKPFNESDDEEKSDIKSPVGVVAFIWEEIWKIRSSNDDLSLIANHLEGVIG